MDAQSYSRLLSYIVCEMTMPVKRHVYNFALSDQISLNTQVLSVASSAAKSHTFKSRPSGFQQVSRNPPKEHGSIVVNTTKEVGTKVVKNGTYELYEGTEIEKSAMTDILMGESCQENSISKKFTDTSYINNDFLVLGVSEPIKESDLANPLLEVLRYSEKEGLGQSEDSILKQRMEEINSPTSLGTEESILPLGGGSENEIEISDNAEINDDISNLYFDPLLLCSDLDFKTMFRISRSTFQLLIEILSKEEMEPIDDVPLYKKVLLVLWLLGNSRSQNDAAQVFGVSLETVTNCFYDVCATLYNRSENFIKWPPLDECNDIASRIETNYGFPGVVGVLGCQYFSISIPKETLSRREHFNGKLRMYCVAVQVVCDDEFVIRDIFPGLPGGLRPGQVLRDSPLSELLSTQACEFVDPHKHILARCEYPQLKSMLTPYSKTSESLSAEEVEFNSLHENVCLLVDRTFQMLRDRFTALKLLDPEIATMVLVTACVLHNICIKNGDIFEA